LKEIRLHGRGGQGVVVASEILVAGFLKDGMHAHSIPFFGVERRGAPVTACVRFDREQIWEKTQVYTPDCIVVMDLRLVKAVDIFAGAKEGCFLIVSSEKFGLDHVPSQISTIGKIDARRIAMHHIGAPITSTCMLGCLAATTKWVSLKSILAGVEEILPHKVAKANQKAVEQAFKQTNIRKR
jgi:2-oxoacid:acceptor oxidoreductase gamma subunit (pyruvate/2-ketoisovalerate family)